MRRRLRNAFLLGIVVGLVVAVVRALRSDAPAAVGSGAAPLPRPSPALRSTSSDGAATGASAVSRPASADAVADEVVAPVTEDPLPDPPPTGDAPAAPAVEPAPTAAQAWVAPVEGACPDGYPVKAKVASRIFHVPEGAFYERTVPDRCYPTADAATADGFRASKR